MTSDVLERLQAALADRYAVEREIGRGGMATVFLAEDLKHRRKVAIKVLHPELAAAVGPDRFLREIVAVAGLTHPHVLPLHDSGEADSLLFYVMPYVEGESLRHRLDREKQLPVDEAIRITQEVAEALDHAHRHGLIHRDIKPGNILLEEGHAVVTDFGVARAISEAGAEKVTATGMAVGTPAYMSPEQAAGEEVDERSDIYALGCVLYEMLAGEPPYTGATSQAVLAKKLAEPVPRVRVVRETVPEPVEAALCTAMARTVADRFSTASEFAKALAADVSTVERKRSSSRYSQGAIAVVALAIASAFAWQLLRPSDSSPTLDPDAIAVLPFRVAGTSDALRTLGADIPDLFWMKVTGDYGPRTVDPATARAMWRAAGGTLETPLTEAQALEIAQSLGAGRLVLGVVAGTEESMSLSATLLDVPAGSVRVRPTAVEGSFAHYLTAADALITQLLAKSMGEPMHRLPSLSKYSPEAVQAYVRGREAWRHGDWPLAHQLFDRALALDSTFVLAALEKYVHGESDHAAARYAWDHRDELTVRDQMHLKAVAGWRFGATPTVVARIAQFDSTGLRDWETDIPFNLHEFGRLAGIPGWRERNQAAREMMLRRDPASFLVAFRLFGLASANRDTAAMHEYVDQLDAHASTPTASLFAVGSGLRLAAVEGDTTRGRQLWERVPALADSAPGWLEAVNGLLLEGRGLSQLDRFFKTVVVARPVRAGFDRDGMVWARSRGHYGEWRTFREAYLARIPPVAAAVYRISDALYLGEPEDASVDSAVAWLELVARGAVGAPASHSDPTPEASNLALSRCWITLWKVAHEGTRGAREVVRYLREEAPLAYRWSVCAGMIEATIAERERGDLRTAVARLDSIVRPVPMEPPLNGFRDGTHFVDNLYLARKLVQVGDTAAALAAARRARPWQAMLFQQSRGIPIDILREEARLAAMVGDTAGAIDAYQHYFALRDARPDHLPWAAQWDSMRVEYGALTGVETP